MNKVAVIVLSWNARKHIPECLRTLAKQSYPEDHYTVVVVDNDSVDGTREWIKQHYPDIHLIENETNVGFAAGNNIGMEWAYRNGYDYVVLLNDDMKVHGAWLAELVAKADSDARIGLVQSKVLFMHEEFRINTIGNPLHPLAFTWSGGYKRLSSEFLDDREIVVASGAAVLIKRSVIDRIGYLDSSLFMYHEDADYSWRARLAGFSAQLAANSKVYHDHTFSFGHRRLYWSERNRLVLFFSNYTWRTIFLLFPAFLLTEIAMIGYAFVQGWGWKKLKSFISFIGMIPRVIKRRRELKLFRSYSDKEIIALMTTRLDFEEVNNPLLTYGYNPLFQLYFLLVRPLLK